MSSEEVFKASEQGYQEETNDDMDCSDSVMAFGDCGWITHEERQLFLVLENI